MNIRKEFENLPKKYNLEYFAKKLNRTSSAISQAMKEQGTGKKTLEKLRGRIITHIIWLKNELKNK
jgi:hypothetical protein